MDAEKWIKKGEEHAQRATWAKHYLLGVIDASVQLRSRASAYEALDSLIEETLAHGRVYGHLEARDQKQEEEKASV